METDGRRIDGELRLYDFERAYASPAKPDARALSGALLLDAHSPTLGGFSAGGSLLGANAFARPEQPGKVDTTLMGPGSGIAAVGQAFVQYRGARMTVRLGDQYLDTPWLGRSDSRVLPASYEALALTLEPARGWKVFASRTYGWKSRTSDGYRADNLYYPAAWRGDAMYGGIGGLPAGASSARGAWVLGVTRNAGGFKGSAWYYDFPGFARMLHADGSYTMGAREGLRPFIAMQYVGETGGGNLLVEHGAGLYGVAGDRVRSRALGIDAGVKVPHGQFDVAWNRLAHAPGAIGGGALVSPYTAGYASDPLFTTSMIRGLVEQGPGHAWKVRFTQGFAGDRVRVQLAYAKYSTLLSGASRDVYLDVAWNLDDWLRGLSVRDRWERATGGVGLNPGNRAFTYNRLMLSYTF